MNRKIVHLIGNLDRGGAEKQLYLVTTSLQHRGWPQTVIAFKPDGAWEGPLRAAGVSVYTIRRHRVKLWRLWELRRLIRREKPGVIVSWQHHLAVYADWLWGVGRVAKICNVRHDWTTEVNQGSPLARLGMVRGALEHADYAISNARATFEKLQQRGVKLPPHKIILNGVVTQARGKADEAAPVPRIAAVGAMVPRKAYDVLLRAAKLLVAEGKRFTLHFIGDGPERPQLEALALQLGLTDCVQFCGLVEDVPSQLAGMHIVAHPSFSEGLSNTILEAMAEGLPVVGTFEAAAEIIDDGRTGLLVPSGRPDRLAAALGRLLEDPALRGRLGAAALQYVRQHCGPEAIIDEYEHVCRRSLETLMAGSSRG